MKVRHPLTLHHSQTYSFTLLPCFIRIQSWESSLLSNGQVRRQPVHFFSEMSVISDWFYEQVVSELDHIPEPVYYQVCTTARHGTGYLSTMVDQLGVMRIRKRSS